MTVSHFPSREPPKAPDPKNIYVVMAAPGVAILVMLGMAPLFLFRGWALSWLWQWYAVPTFGLAPIGMMTGFAICLAAVLLTPLRSLAMYHEAANENGLKLIVSNLGATTLGLLMGWAGSYFV